MSLTLLSVLLGLALQQGPEPRITAVKPDRLTVSAKAQPLAVTGENFANTITVQVTTPGGAVRTADAKAVAQPQKTSFSLSYVFDEVGKYELVVLNPDGRRSGPFAVLVRAVAPQPWIERADPEEVPRGQEVQAITLMGRNFDSGLRVSVTDPTGNVTQATTIDRVTPLSVVLRFAFETSGRYEFLVTNPSGESSNVTVVEVRPFSGSSPSAPTRDRTAGNRD
jgi:hypothetical protein